jgi:hypothetical protein
MSTTEDWNYVLAGRGEFTWPGSLPWIDSNRPLRTYKLGFSPETRRHNRWVKIVRFITRNHNWNSVWYERVEAFDTGNAYRWILTDDNFIVHMKRIYVWEMEPLLDEFDW